ncbi:hypothetical protein G6F35_018574 [Rhizopus arrhizus]|nr:hypothetical protein G6F35_018574 [Rhizopus arrhizus]
MSPISAPRLRHEPDDALGARDEIMAFRLGGNARQDRAHQFGVAGSAAQQAAQRHLGFLPQAQVQRAVHA